MADLLNIGKTGLDASRKSLKTTGHNIANANTEGYSRQRVQQTTNNPINKAGHIMGTGARVVGVNRVHDQFIEKKLMGSMTTNQFHQSRAEHLEQVENIFNEIDGEGLNHVLNNFYNAFRELANQPENEAVRSIVRDNAGLVVKDFRRMRNSLDNEARMIDQKIGVEIEDINSILHRVAELNNKITVLEVGNNETGDLRDQRDVLVRTLSESFKVNSYLDEKNRYVLSADGVGTLVTGTEVQELAAKSVSQGESNNNMPGSVEIYLKSKPTHSITDNFKHGRLGALAKLRNGDIQNLQNQVDQIAFEFSKTVNSVHQRGYVNREVQVDEFGNANLFDQKGPTTGLNFFVDLTDKQGAALKLDLHEDVKNDLSNIATALTPNSPGDNRIALAISKLQHEKVMGGGTTTLEEEYLQTIASVGVEVGKARFDNEQARGLLAQAQNMKERVSGVSIDEETANLVRYQHAYDASAKVMQTADEMFQTVLALKR